MMNIKRFHPGVYLKDELEVLNMTASEFSLRTGISERTLSGLFNQNGSITFDIAYKLSNYFGNSISFWTNLQNSYDLYLRQEQEQNEIEEDWNLIKSNSLKNYLIYLKIIELNDEKKVVVQKTRNVLGVNNLIVLQKKDAFVNLKEQYVSHESNEFLKNFWIALSLNKGRRQNVNEYNKMKLKSKLKEIRSLTLLEPKDFVPRLINIFSECGISFVILPYLAKSNIYGITKWYNKDSALLAISNRGEKADMFWFTLFHEIAHVLMEHRREPLINEMNIEDVEANRLSEELLIKRSDWNKFILKGVFTKESIERFAKKIGILPCIVLGRLHKEKIIPYGVYDKDFNVSYRSIYEYYTNR